MTLILILKIAGIIAGSSIITGFITWFVGKIKLKKAIDKKQKEIARLDNRIDFYQKNKQAYQSVVEKLMKRKKNATKLREKINSSDGSDLSDILNEL